MASINPQLHPLQTNSETGEVFLTLKKHPNIIITPPRLTDPDDCTPILNDPRINEWLPGVPRPYLIEDAITFQQSIKPPCDAVLAELEAAKDTKQLIIVGESPLRAIRELQPQGGDVFLGDFGFKRCLDKRLLEHFDATVDVEENRSRPVGDPEIVWTIGDYLKPSHHNRGIMTDVIGTIMSEWAIPRMNVKHVVVTALGGNEGSVRVFEKNGFIHRKTVKDYVGSKGCMCDLHILEWKAVL